MATFSVKGLSDGVCLSVCYQHNIQHPRLICIRQRAPLYHDLLLVVGAYRLEA